VPPLHLPDLLRVWTLSEARPLENVVNMLRAQTIHAETAELLSAGKQQLVGALGIVLGLDEDHVATDIH